MLPLRRVAAVVTLAVALTACSNGNKNVVTDNPQAALSVAAKRTAEGGSVKMKLSAKTGTLAILDGTGAYDFKRETGRFTVTGALIRSLNLIITTDKVYVETPNKPKKWAALTDADLANSPQAGFLSSIRSQVDPRENLRNLGQTTTNVRVIGEEEINGAKATHLRGDVDLSEEAIAKAPADMRADLRKAREAANADSYPIEVWLDDDGRVRRLTYSLTAGAGAQAASTTVTLDLFDFGKDPGIVIPKASDVQNGLPAS
jgi:hypothetical protein